MDMGLGQVETGCKRRATETVRSSNLAEEEIKNLKEQVKLLTKASLSTLQAVRLLKSITMGAAKFAASTNFAEVAELNKKQYLAAAKKLKADEVETQIGVPSAHLFICLLEEALKMSEEDKALLEQLTALKKYHEQVAQMDLKDRLLLLGKEVKHLKVAPAYHKTVRKLEWSIEKGTPSDEAFQSILKAIETASNRATAHSFKIHVGQAPKGELERLLQAQLEEAE